MPYLASTTHPHLFGWYVGFVVATLAIVLVVILVQAILGLARNIGVQAQAAIQGLEDCWSTTAPLWDLATTVDHASAITAGLFAVRHSLGG